MRILITRPIEDAKPLADALEERGIEVLIEPLLEIRHLEDAEIDLDGVQALLFTSANGVRAFAALSPRRDLKVFTVGDGSADAARQAGFPNVESAKGDVEALAALVVDRLKAEDGILFHAAGTVTAGDLKTRLEGARLSRAAGAALRGEDRHRLVDRDPRQSDAGRHRRDPAVLAPHGRAPSPNCGGTAGSPSLARIQALASAPRWRAKSALWAGRRWRSPTGRTCHPCWPWWMLPAAKEPKWPSHPSAPPIQGASVPPASRRGPARRRRWPPSARPRPRRNPRPRAGNGPAAARCCFISF